MHNGFITVDNEKMSKSAGNFFTVREISEKFPYEVIRFFILSGHYRMPLNFSDTLMQASQNGLERIKNCISSLDYYIENCSVEEKDDDAENEKAVNGFLQQFETAMDDDFNTADAITAIYELVKFINVKINESFSKKSAVAAKNMIKELCNVLGVLQNNEEDVQDPEKDKIEELIAKRAEAKKAKDFATADAIRDELSAMGITIKDTRQGVQWFRG